MDHYQQTYSFCIYCLEMFPSDALEHHMHNDCAGYRLAMETNILPPWIPSQVNNIENQTPHGVSLGTESNFEEGQNENVSYIQNIIMDSHQPSNDDVSSTKPNREEPQNENDTYSQDNIMDSQHTSCSGDLSTEPNCEGSQDENGDYNRTSRDGSLTELNCEEPQDEMDGNYVCNDCSTCKRNHRYGSKGRLIWHIQTSQMAHYQRLYSCDEHQLLFINRKTLREHMKTDYRRQRDNVDQNPPAQTSNSAAYDDTPHEGFFDSYAALLIHYTKKYPFCSYCQRVLPNGDALQQHMHYNCAMYRLVMAQLSSGAGPNQWEQPGRSTDYGRQVSNVDPNPFAQPSSSTAHHETSPGDFQCNLCEKSQINQSGLKYHYNADHRLTELKKGGLLSKHGEDVPAEQRNVPTTLRLGKRYARDHCQTKYKHDECSRTEFECNRCGRTFARRFNLKVHQENLISCKKCTATFCTKYDLAAHINATHMPDPFVCIICGKGFLSMHQWKTHECSEDYKSGKYYKCTGCNRVFHLHSILRQHNCKKCQCDSKKKH
ncbi:hypothetical protein TKK_0015105 [Trichogramma kaykai]